MLRIAITALLLSLAYPGAAHGCRVEHFDALTLLAGLDETEEPVAAFVGEIVGVRSAGRLDELKQCRPPISAPQNEQEDRLDCVEAPPDIELDVYPLDVLHGMPEYPTTLLAVGCSYIAPRVGSRTLVVQTTAGSVVHIYKGDEPDYHVGYDDVYLGRVRACITEKCLNDTAE